MKKKGLALFVAMAIAFWGFQGASMCVLAEETIAAEGEDLDFSYFTEENSLVGYASVPRGVYLASGDSHISKISSYKIGVGGITNAAVRCDVSVTLIVERYNMQKDVWQSITSWQQENENAFSAAISKSLIVDCGYYYRVRCLHYAETDSSSSYTNALYVN